VLVVLSECLGEVGHRKSYVLCHFLNLRLLLSYDPYLEEVHELAMNLETLDIAQHWLSLFLRKFMKMSSPKEI